MGSQARENRLRLHAPERTAIRKAIERRSQLLPAMPVEAVEELATKVVTVQ